METIMENKHRTQTTFNEDELSPLKNITVGYSEDSFVVAINKNRNGVYESAYSVPAKILKEIVALLFQVGVEFQEKTKLDIGFGLGDDDNEQ